MNLDLRIGPMMQRPPTSNRPILHLLEYILDNKLAAIGLDDLGIGPIVSACNQYVLAKIRLRKLMERLGVDHIVKLANLVRATADRYFNHTFHVLPAEDLVALALYRFSRRRLAALDQARDYRLKDS